MPNDNASGNSLRRVRVREKYFSRSATWRTATLSRFSPSSCGSTTESRTGFACSHWADMGGGCSFPTPISTFCSYSEAKEQKRNRGRSSPNFRGPCGTSDSESARQDALSKSASAPKRTTRNSTWRSCIGKAGAAFPAGANSQTDQGTAHALRKYDFSSLAKRQRITRRHAGLSGEHLVAAAH